MLQLAQVEGGSAKSRFETVDLAGLVHTIVDVFEPAAQDAGQRLTADVPGKAVHVLGDKALLGQMLSNLIENALRHTSQGSLINVSLGLQGAAVVLSVSDNGPGIPKDQRGKVLQRLYRLDRSRHTPGNGLGLSLVRQIAVHHGGWVQCEARPDGGTCFRVRLPMRGGSSI